MPKSYSMGSLDVAALFQSNRQALHGLWPSLSSSIDVATEATKHEYCAKNTVQFLTASKQYSAIVKRLLATMGGSSRVYVQGSLPGGALCSSSSGIQKMPGKSPKTKTAQIVRKLSFEQGMV